MTPSQLMVILFEDDLLSWVLISLEQVYDKTGLREGGHWMKGLSSGHWLWAESHVGPPTQ